MVDHAQLVRRRSDPRRARSRHRRKARRPGRGQRRRRHLEGPDRQREPVWPATSPPRCATSRRSTTAVANGDLSQKITVDAQGRDPRAQEHHQHDGRPAATRSPREVTRVAKEVGTEGKLGGQAEVQGRRRHLEGPDRQRERPRRQPDRPGAKHRQGHDRRRQRRPLAEDHRRRQGRDPRAEEHHQHDGGSAPLLRRRGDPRRAKRSAPKASWAARPTCKASRGTWKDLTDNVNVLAGNLTDQVRNIAKVTTAVANGDLSQKITVDAKGEILELKNTINTMVDQLRLLRRRSDPRRQGGRHRRKAGRPGRGAKASPAPGRTSPTTSTSWPST